jgi:RNA polymerase nonessential primary-like sigma factor
MLTEQEEITAGKFSQMGHRLQGIKGQLRKSLVREPTDEEWAAAAKMTPGELIMYINLAVQARNRLVQHNIRIVDHWARRLIEHSNVGKEVNYYELVAEGLIGLTKAAESFKVGKNTRFYTHAEVYVRSELYKGLSKLRPGSWTPHKTHMTNAKVQKAQNYLQYTLKRPPTDEELGEHLNMKVDTIRQIRREVKLKVMSGEGLVKKNNDDEKTDSYFDMGMKSSTEATQLDDVLWRVEFNSLLDILTPSEKRTISIRFGLMDGRPRSLELTAELMSESSEQTRITINKAMEKLRDSKQSESLLKYGPDSPLLSDSTTSSGIGNKYVHMY